MASRTVNFYQIVYDCLGRHSTSAADKWARKFPSTAADDVDVAVQQRNVNAFWRLQLGRLSIDTINARECLSDEVCPATWLKDFGHYVVPVLLAHNLPE